VSVCLHSTMSLNPSLLVVLSLLFISAVHADTLNGDDLLIREVVDGQDASSSNLLSAEQHHFSLFKSKFKKSYGSQEEHDYRFSVFKANLRRAARHQELDPTASHGVTQFSDLTPAEFRKQVLGLRRLRLPKDANEAPILPTSDLPEDFDWRDKGAVGPIKNQVFFLSWFFTFFVFLIVMWWVFFFQGWVLGGGVKRWLILNSWFFSCYLFIYWWFIYLGLSRLIWWCWFCFVGVRVRVGHAGVLVPQELWKVPTFLQLESLLASVSSSLWIAIMRCDSLQLVF